MIHPHLKLFGMFSDHLSSVFTTKVSSNFRCVKTALHKIEIILTTEAGRQTPDGRSARGQSRQSESGPQGFCCFSKKHVAYLLTAASNMAVLSTSCVILIEMQSIKPVVEQLLHVFMSCEQGRWLPCCRRFSQACCVANSLAR